MKLIKPVTHLDLHRTREFFTISGLFECLHFPEISYSKISTDERIHDSDSSPSFRARSPAFPCNISEIQSSSPTVNRERQRKYIIPLVPPFPPPNPTHIPRWGSSVGRTSHHAPTLFLHGPKTRDANTWEGETVAERPFSLLSLHLGHGLSLSFSFPLSPFRFHPPAANR